VKNEGKKPDKNSSLGKKLNDGKKENTLHFYAVDGGEDTPCTPTLQVVERDTLCTYRMLTVEGDKPSMSLSTLLAM
jgi:hypothetical protein